MSTVTSRSLALRALQILRTRYAALATLLLALLGLALFYFVDDVFNPLFTVSLICIIGGFLLTGFLLSFALVKSPRWWKKIAGYIGSFILAIASIAIVIAVVDYRFFFFYHKMSAEAWKQDLRFLADNVESVHPHPFAKIKKEEFEQEVRNLDQQIPNLSDEQIAMRLIKLEAMIGDGHSTSFPFQPATGFRMYPLRLYQFSDGLYVTGASDHYRQVVGNRVVRIGNKPVEQVYELLKPFIAADNEFTVRERMPLYYVCSGVLHSQGIAESPDEAVWTFADDAGNQSQVTIKPVSLITYFYWLTRPLQRFKYKPAVEPSTPLYLRESQGNYYWSTYLEPSKTLYVQINQILNKSGQSFTQFGKQLIEFANTHAIDRVVIDIRRNDGGDNTVYRQFVEDISHSPKINQRGHLFTLIGRGTFSAAVNFTTALEKKTETLFVGESTGAGPNHYGDARMVFLPNSKSIFFVSTRSWQLSDAQDTRSAHEPDLPVAVSHLDYFTNRDPVLDAALQYQIPKTASAPASFTSTRPRT